MTTEENRNDKDSKTHADDGEKIELGFTQMEILYKSRCVQSPVGKNVFVREIETEE